MQKFTQFLQSKALLNRFELRDIFVNKPDCPNRNVITI